MTFYLQRGWPDGFKLVPAWMAEDARLFLDDRLHFPTVNELVREIEAKDWLAAREQVE